MRNLRLSGYGTPTPHAQAQMRALGITYRVATPQSLGDQWWFWGCENVPAELPSHITELNVSPDSPHSCLTAAEKRLLREGA